MSSRILPRASQTAQGGWRLQWYGQGGAASRCGLGWQQADLCNTWSWIRSEIRPWHLLQMGAAAELLSPALETVFSFYPITHFPYYLVQGTWFLHTLDFSFLQIIFHCLSAVALLPPQSWVSLHRPWSCFVSRPKQRHNLSNKEEFGDEQEQRTAKMA